LEQGKNKMKTKKWGDLAPHRAGCPYKGVSVYGTEEEMVKYYSGDCPGCNVRVKWEERDLSEKSARLEQQSRSTVSARANRAI
jgi:hypothetical protein